MDIGQCLIPFQNINQIHTSFLVVAISPTQFFNFRLHFLNLLHLLFRWHALMPDSFTFGNTNYDLANLVYRPEVAPEVGMREFVGTLALTKAGEITHGNHAPPVMRVIRVALKQGRDLRLQSFNNYRR